MQRVCFDEADDVLRASGWPHRVIFVDGHPHEARADKFAFSALSSGVEKYHGVWPREVAYRYVRAIAASRFDRWRLKQEKKPRAAFKALSIAGPPTKAEAKSWLVDAVVSYADHEHIEAEEFVYLIEAIIGADEALDALATGFETATDKIDRRGRNFYQADFKGAVAGAIAFVALRASKSARARHLPRLAKEQVRFTKAAVKTDDFEFCAESLALSLEGSVAIKRRFGANAEKLRYLDYAGDDPDWVRELVAANPEAGCTIRLVAIAGVAAMKNLANCAFSAGQLAPALRDFGMVRAPESVAFAISLLGRTSVKDAPIKWLIAHADYARPFVERAAKHGPNAAVARAALRQLRSP